MIIKNRVYTLERNGNNMLFRLLWYIKRKTENNKPEYKTIFWATGRKLDAQNLYDMEEAYRRNYITRMIIFSPLNYNDPRFLSEKTRETLLRYIKDRNLVTTRFAYGLHYNTAHPHSHVVMVANDKFEIMFNKANIYRLNKVAREVFGEPIGASAYSVLGEEVNHYEAILGKSKSREIRAIIKKKSEELDNEIKEEEKEIEREAPKDLTLEDLIGELSLF